jgi:sodium-dependent dicarboxylate transporter 2/3/5
MFLIAYSHPTSSLSSDALAVIGITLMAIILFVSSAIPLPATALLIAFFQVFFKVNRPEQVARNFAGDSMFFILGILLISNIMIAQKIDRRLASLLINLTGYNLSRLIFGLIFISAIIASFIGQHTAGTLLFPVVMALISGFETDVKTREKRAKLLLFALTYSTMVGGMATPSGGPRNALMIEYLWRICGVKVSYLQWMIMAMPIALAILPMIYFSLRFIFRVNSKQFAISADFRQKISSGDNKFTTNEKRTIGIFILILLLWIFFSAKIGLGMITIFGVMLYLITNIADWNEISRKTNWGIILIYASSLSLGLAMQQTGVTAAFADWITNLFYNLNLDSNSAVIASVCVVSTLLTNALSYGPSVAVSGPIFLRLADISHLNVLVIGASTALAASFSYLTVVSAPVNTLIYMTGYVKAKDFLKIGIICTVLSIVITVLFAIFYWKILGYQL